MKSGLVNFIPNGDFCEGEIGDLPLKWEVHSPYPSIQPIFKLLDNSGRTVLMATGDGNPDCLGWISTRFQLTAGKTYLMQAAFRMSTDLNPQMNLLFSLHWGDGLNDGVFKFRRLGDGLVEGHNRIFVQGEGEVDVEARIFFRLSATGTAWIEEISLEECGLVQPRHARFACTYGNTDLSTWGRVLDEIGPQGVDLVLLPETFNPGVFEPLDGPSNVLMSNKARQYGMYVAGTFIYDNKEDNRVYNAAVIHDRCGDLMGMYYKHHPYANEWFVEGTVPGTEIPVFTCDFGKVGFIVCSDSWYTDVTELLALKGTEVILFPSAGFYRSLMPARASDYCVRIVASSHNTGHGIWDTTGAEITNPDADWTRYGQCDGTFKDLETCTIEGIGVLMATLDLSMSPSPHNWGGPIFAAPGGRRNRREQKRLLTQDIADEINRWWDE